MHTTFKRNNSAYSLIETMTVIAVLAIVLGLLYAYSDQGWKLFYQSYSRGLSQVKARIAIRQVVEELREANKSRIAIDRGGGFGIPFPDDVASSSPYIYFTKPVIHESTGEVIGYDYLLYSFAKPKEKFDKIETNQRKRTENEQVLILKSIKFINESKFYTEDKDKNWPFLPPLLEIQKSTLDEDKAFIESINQDSQKQSTEPDNTPKQVSQTTNADDGIFLDHFARLKKDSRNVPISGNFKASSLTDPFSKEDANIFFGLDYKSDKPIKIKVSLEESPLLFGLKAAMSEFEVKVTPRN